LAVLGKKGRCCYAGGRGRVGAERTPLALQNEGEEGNLSLGRKRE